MQGKLCLVTGATSGLGKATAIALARLGADVVIGCRDPAKGEQVKREIDATPGHGSVELFVADLSSLQSIRAAVTQFKQSHKKLDVLVNQAGLYTGKRQQTDDGFEMMFAVNHLAYFYLTTELLDTLKAAGAARVVNGSGGIEGIGTINFDDLQSTRSFSGFKGLAQSKLANFLFSYELARRLKGTGVTSNVMHPGGVKTELGKGQGGMFGIVLRLMRPMMSTPEVGADTLVWLASAPELKDVSGGFFVKRKPGKSSKQSHDAALATRLWEESERLCRASLL